MNKQKKPKTKNKQTNKPRKKEKYPKKQTNKNNNNNNSNNNGNSTATKVTINTEIVGKTIVGNTNFKIEVVCTIKTTKILKYTCFHVIPYIHSPMMGLFPHISMATMTTFPVTSLIVEKTNWVE